MKKELVYKLSQLIENNVELIDSLNVLIKIYKGNKKEKILQVKKSLERGVPLHISFSIISKEENFLNLLQVAEKTGDIKGVFKILANKYEFEEKIKKDFMVIMIYPVSVLILSFFLFIFILIYILPKFNDIYIQLGVKLPLITRIILYLSNNIYLVFGFFILLFLVIYILRELILRRISLYKEYVIIKFLSSMYVNLSAKISFLDSLNNSYKLNDLLIEKKIKKAYMSLYKGNKVDKIFDKDYFGDEFLAYITIGEKTGNMELIFKNMLNIYSQKFRVKIKTYLKILEPLMILFISFIVALLIIAIMLPILNMGDSIQNI